MTEVIYVQDSAGDAHLLSEAFNELQYNCKVIVLHKITDVPGFMVARHKSGSLPPIAGIVISVAFFDALLKAFLEFASTNKDIIACPIYVMGPRWMRVQISQYIPSLPSIIDVEVSELPADWDATEAFANHMIAKIGTPVPDMS